MRHPVVARVLGLIVSVVAPGAPNFVGSLIIVLGIGLPLEITSAVVVHKVVHEIILKVVDEVILKVAHVVILHVVHVLVIRLAVRGRLVLGLIQVIGEVVCIATR